jgi:predicted GNAT family acetyltransferase
MTDVRHDEAERRYELEVDGRVAIAAYRLEDGAVAFTHTVVPPELEGQGVGSRLIAGALADVRARGLRFIPRCSFVAAYAQRHPEVRDLLAE